MYCALYWILRALLSLMFRLHVDGAENIPRRGPVLVVVNHFSAWDPPVAGIVVPRPVYFMAKIELFRIAPVGWLLRHLRVFPVRRGTADRQAIRSALAVLGSGQALIIFPEGHRSETGTLQDVHAGAVFLAQKTGCPVVPMGIFGQYGWRRPIYCRIGRPFTIPADMPRRAAQALMAERIREQIDAGRAAWRR